MSATAALRWASTVGACDVSDAPDLPDAAADLLRRLDFPIVPAAGGVTPEPAAERIAGPAAGTLPPEAA